MPNFIINLVLLLSKLLLLLLLMLLVELVVVAVVCGRGGVFVVIPVPHMSMQGPFILAHGHLPSPSTRLAPSHSLISLTLIIHLTFSHSPPRFISLPLFIPSHHHDSSSHSSHLVTLISQIHLAQGQSHSRSHLSHSWYTLIITEVTLSLISLTLV